MFQSYQNTNKVEHFLGLNLKPKNPKNMFDKKKKFKIWPSWFCHQAKRYIHIDYGIGNFQYKESFVVINALEQSTIKAPTPNMLLSFSSIGTSTSSNGVITISIMGFNRSKIVIKKGMTYVSSYSIARWIAFSQPIKIWNGGSNIKANILQTLHKSNVLKNPKKCLISFTTFCRMFLLNMWSLTMFHCHQQGDFF